MAYSRGGGDAARRAYERALELEPDQAEARYNLANLLDDMGDTDLAVAELRAVVSDSKQVDLRRRAADISDVTAAHREATAAIDQVLVALALVGAGVAAFWCLQHAGVPQWWPTQAPTALLPGLTIS